MSLRLHYICSLRLMAGGFLKCFRGIRRKDLLKINVIPDSSAGEPLKIFRGECRRLVCLFQPSQYEVVCLGNNCILYRTGQRC